MDAYSMTVRLALANPSQITVNHSTSCKYIWLLKMLASYEMNAKLSDFHYLWEGMGCDACMLLLQLTERNKSVRFCLFRGAGCPSII